MEGPQQGRATKLLNMSRQQLSVVIDLLTGHLGLNGQYIKLERIKIFYAEGVSTAMKLLNTCYVNVNP